MLGRKCYLLNDNVGPDLLHRVPPFGYPADEPAQIPEITPLTSAQLESYCSVGNTFAMTDVDIINVPDPTVSWWIDLPKKPVHGPVRNELYFDWHVGTKPIAY